MKLTIREDRCAGQGCCAANAPEVFELDGSGFNIAIGGTIDVPAGLQESARIGMLSCPEGAIELVEE